MANSRYLRMITFTIIYYYSQTNLPSIPVVVCPCLKKGLSYMLSSPSGKRHVVAAFKMVIFSMFLGSFFVMRP